MFVGLAITSVVSYWVSENLQFQFRLFTSPWLGWGIFIIQIVVVVALNDRVNQMNSGGAAPLFLLYAALAGVSLSSIFLL